MQIPASLRSLPNQLTVARILAIPVICLMIVVGWDWLRWLALLIYVAAAITDWVGSSRVDLQACKLEYSIVSPK